MEATGQCPKPFGSRKVTCQLGILVGVLRSFPMSCSNQVFDASVKKNLDQFSESHTDLRISVTDRCNLRCGYCMPLDASFLSQQKLLTYGEIVRCARVVSEWVFKLSV